MATGNVPRGFPRILQWLLAGLMLIIGLAIGILGAKLASVGGTFYFAIMGLVMVIASALIFRNRRGGILLYGLAFIVSIVWAISDAGWTYWPLFSRLFALGVLAFLCALVWPFLSRQPAKKGPRLAWQRCWQWSCWQVSAGCSNLSLWSAPARRCRLNRSPPASSRRTGRTGATPPTAIASPPSTRLTNRT